ncbi:hypothetical protein LTR54_017095 [Friedmanniomyces endolithicus]|nr:hypothetical protein LTS00_016465 [Friedmanniomyces endolithicus]KAK0974460.1 hypothetical protein LTR54_017095 [Friedmanniomyces endolithicus]
MTSRERSVSPVGASRFERPLKAPVNGVRRVFTSNASSPTSTTSAYTRGGHSSTASTSATTTNTSPSTPTSSVLPSHPKSKPTTTMPSSPYPSRPSTSPSLDADEWLARFPAVYDLPIYSSDGASRPFGSLYDPSYALHTRQLVLFVRHFYCGACQAYLTALAQGISKEDYFGIPTPTSIIVIGCGQPDLIKHYKRFTSCPFPIFADPSRSLFKKLGMSLSANIGRVRPEYMKDISAPAWLAGQVSTVKKSLKDPEGIRKRDVLRGGNPMQIGGKFLFEDGEVVWCHRMRDYRGHAEVGVLREVLGLEG